MALPSSDVIGPVLIALVTGGVAKEIYRSIFQKRQITSETNRSDAEGAAIIVSSASALLTPLKERINEMNDELDTLREELKQVPILQEQVRVLTERLARYEQSPSGN